MMTRALTGAGASAVASQRARQSSRAGRPPVMALGCPARLTGLTPQERATPHLSHPDLRLWPNAPPPLPILMDGKPYATVTDARITCPPFPACDHSPPMSTAPLCDPINPSPAPSLTSNPCPTRFCIHHRRQAGWAVRCREPAWASLPPCNSCSSFCSWAPPWVRSAGREAGALGGGAGQCPTGMVAFGDSCYFFEGTPVMFDDHTARAKKCRYLLEPSRCIVAKGRRFAGRTTLTW